MRVRLEQQPLLRFEPAIQQEQRLVVPYQAERVQEPDDAEEEPRVAHRVERLLQHDVAHGSPAIGRKRNPRDSSCSGAFFTLGR